ncbi:MAG: hypothetical protein KDB07_03805 [Planctomycetes bacterium]|nr:hypothetical protein [Planctomycetota bacterium]
MNTKTLILLSLGASIGGWLAFSMLSDDPAPLPPNAENHQEVDRPTRQRKTLGKTEATRTEASEKKTEHDTSPAKNDEAAQEAEHIPEKPQEKGDEKSFTELLSAFKAAYNSGDFRAMAKLREEILRHAPLSQHAEFKSILHGNDEFGLRTQLLQMLSSDDNALIWELTKDLPSLIAQIRNAPKSTRGGEYTWLHETMTRGLPLATLENGGLETLKAIADAMAEMPELELVYAALHHAPESSRADLLPFLRAELELRKPVPLPLAMLLFRFEGGTDARTMLLDDPRLESFRVPLLIDALRENLLDRGLALKRAREVLNQPNTPDAPILLFEIGDIDPPFALEFARSSYLSSETSLELKSVSMQILAKHGSNEEAASLLAIALRADDIAPLAAEALVFGGRNQELAELFQNSKSGATKVIALQSLLALDRDAWIERALAAQEPAEVRRAALGHLEPQRESEANRLKSIGISDALPSIRRAALQKLGSTEDLGLLEYFRERLSTEADPTVKVEIQRTLTRLEAKERRQR